MTSVLFVCMGNICRSPSAEGVFRALVTQKGVADQFTIDSCGTIDYHAGESPDPRAQETAAGRGIDISNIKARKYHATDFSDFDHIIAMDRDNLVKLLKHCPEEFHHKIRLFCAFSPGRSEEEVPDPYYGGDQGFESVYDLIQDASEGLLMSIQGDTAK